MYKNRQVIAILPAAGNSSRMGVSHSKLLCKIDGIEVLSRTLRALEESGFFDLILIACRDQDLPAFAKLAAGINSKVEFVRGGDTRQQSVFLALEKLKAEQLAAQDALIVVHDAARCFVSKELIANCIEAADNNSAATAALECVDTVYQVDQAGALEPKLLQRNLLRTIQTPQVFDFDLIYRAHMNSVIQASDDAGLVAQIAKVVCVPGEIGNKKITCPEDLF